MDTSTQSFETTWGEKGTAEVVEGAWYERVNWFGVGGILCMYVIMVAFGLWASRKKGQNVEAGGNEMEANMVAGRNIGVIVGCFTMTGWWWTVMAANLFLEERNDVMVIVFVVDVSFCLQRPGSAAGTSTPRPKKSSPRA